MSETLAEYKNIPTNSRQIKDQIDSVLDSMVDIAFDSRTYPSKIKNKLQLILKYASQLDNWRIMTENGVIFTIDQYQKFDHIISNIENMFMKFIYEIIQNKFNTTTIQNDTNAISTYITNKIPVYIVNDLGKALGYFKKGAIYTMTGASIAYRVQIADFLLTLLGAFYYIALYFADAIGLTNSVRMLVIDYTVNTIKSVSYISIPIIIVFTLYSLIRVYYRVNKRLQQDELLRIADTLLGLKVSRRTSPVETKYLKKKIPTNLITRSGTPYGIETYTIDGQSSDFFKVLASSLNKKKYKKQSKKLFKIKQDGRKLSKRRSRKRSKSRSRRS